MTPDTLTLRERRLIRRVAKALRADFEQELAAAVAAERDQVLYGLRTLAKLNGSGADVLHLLGGRVGKAITHAPKGGVTIGGKEYRGGEFIPAGEMAKASPAEKAELERKHAEQGGEKADIKTSMTAAPHAHPDDDRDTSEILGDDLGLPLDRADEKEVDRLTDSATIRRLSAVPKPVTEMSVADIQGRDEEIDALEIDDPDDVPPIIVGYDGDLIDGHHRLAGLIAAGHKSAPVIVADEGDLAAAREFGGLQGRGSWSEEMWVRWMQARSQLPPPEDATGPDAAAPSPADDSKPMPSQERRTGKSPEPAPRTVDRSEALVRKLMAPSGPTTAETVKQLHEALSGHSKAELNELKQRLGIKASGPRAEMARKIAERAAAYDRSNRNLYVNEKVSVDEAHERVKAMAADGSLRTPQGITALTKMIAGGLTGDELKELKQRLGIKASGAKMEVARKLVERGAVKQEPPDKEAVPAAGDAPPVADAKTPPLDPAADLKQQLRTLSRSATDSQTRQAFDIAASNMTVKHGDPDHVRQAGRRLMSVRDDLRRLGHHGAADAVEGALGGIATRLHEPGETHPFDPSTHEGDGNISRGTPVTVTRAGYTIGDPTGSHYVLGKSKVQSHRSSRPTAPDVADPEQVLRGIMTGATQKYQHADILRALGQVEDAANGGPSAQPGKAGGDALRALAAKLGVPDPHKGDWRSLRGRIREHVQAGAVAAGKAGGAVAAAGGAAPTTGGNAMTQDDIKAAAPTIGLDELQRVGLVRNVGGKWQYQFKPGTDKWFPAMSEAGAVNAGRDAYARFTPEALAAASAPPTPPPPAPPPGPTTRPAGEAGGAGGATRPTSAHPLGEWSRPAADGGGLGPVREGDVVRSRRVRVEHSRGYTGKRAGKSWVAKINGTHGTMGFDRDFQDADDTDWGDLHPGKAKGSWHTEHDLGEGVYETAEHGERAYVIHFAARKNDRPMLMHAAVSADALKAALKAAETNGLSADDIPHAVAAFGPEVGTLAARVGAYAEALAGRHG